MIHLFRRTVVYSFLCVSFEFFLFCLFFFFFFSHLFPFEVQADCFRSPTLMNSVPLHFLQRRSIGGQGRLLSDVEAGFLLRDIFELSYSIRTINRAIEKWLEIRDRVGQTFVQLLSNFGNEMQLFQMISISATHPGSLFLYRWFMDPRIVHQVFSGFLGRVSKRFEECRTEMRGKILGVLRRLVMGDRHFEASSGFFVKATGLPNLVLMGVLLILAAADLSIGQTQDCMYHLMLLFEVHEFESYARVSRHNAFLLGTLHIQALLLLKEVVSTVLFDSRMSCAISEIIFEKYRKLPAICLARDGYSYLERDHGMSTLWVQVLLDRAAYLKVKRQKTAKVLGAIAAAMIVAGWDGKKETEPVSGRKESARNGSKPDGGDSTTSPSTSSAGGPEESRSEDYTLQTKLNYVLRTPKVMDLFKLFCVQTFCDENVDCWLGIREYETLPNDQTLMRDKAQKLWQEFFVESAERPININQDVRVFLHDRIFGERVLNPYIFQEAGRSLETLMGGEILKHFFTSNLFKINVSKEELSNGLKRMHLESRSQLVPQTFSEEDSDVLVHELYKGPTPSVQLQVLRLASRLGANIFSCFVASHGLVLLKETGVLGSSECLMYADRLLTASLAVGSLIFVCNKLVPNVAKLLEYDRKMMRRIVDHAADLVSIFNDTRKKEFLPVAAQSSSSLSCAFIFEELSMLIRTRRSKDIGRIQQLLEMSSFGQHDLRLSAFVFELASGRVQRNKVKDSENLLFDEVKRLGGLLKDNSAETTDRAKLARASCEMFLLLLKSLISLNGKRAREAVVFCQSLVLASPYQDALLLVLAKFYDFVGEEDKAEEFYRAILSMEPPIANLVTFDNCYSFVFAMIRVGELTLSPPMLRACVAMIGELPHRERLAGLRRRCIRELLRIKDSNAQKKSQPENEWLVH